MFWRELTLGYICKHSLITNVNDKTITFVKTEIITMKERILEFLRMENKTSAQFAEEIGVQPSGISHIISGRNNPSLDFVLKMLEKYPSLSTDWLLFGRGSIYKEPKMADLFSDIEMSKPENSVGNKDKIAEKQASEKEFVLNNQAELSERSIQEHYRVSKIVWFFDDNTFKEYYPHKD